jgi:hypothetical protein
MFVAIAILLADEARPAARLLRNAFPEREDSPMTTHRFTVERIDVTTKGSFEQATAAFGHSMRGGGWWRSFPSDLGPFRSG